VKASTVDNLRQSVILTAVFFMMVFGSNAWGQPRQPGGDPGAVLIQKIEFIGNTVIDTEALQKVVKDFVNRELTLEDMSELADLVTMTYQERGYILARAYLPEQEIQSGILKIAIAEGRIGKVVVSGKTHYHDRVVKRFFKKQEAHKVVNEALLEKGLLYTKGMEDL